MLMYAAPNGVPGQVAELVCNNQPPITAQITDVPDPTGEVASQIGWNPSAASNVLTLAPAGHTPGMYEISMVVVVRATVAGTTSAILSWSSPIFGAEVENPSVLINISGLGTTFSNTNSSSAMHRSVPIMSDGTAPITLQLAAFLAGVIDIYATARLIATT